MERLVLVKTTNYKTGLFVFGGFILFVLGNVAWDYIKSDKSVPIDPSMYVLGAAFMTAWVAFALRMFFYAYPRSITKLPDGFYEVRTGLIKHLVAQEELEFSRSSLRKGFKDYDLYFDYVVVPYTLLNGRVRLVFEKDIPLPVDDDGLVIRNSNLWDNSKLALVIGRDYKYEGDGDPYNFFRDTRPPERKKPPKPKVEEIPPERDNPYGIELPDE
ncbi:hypothetical protein [Fibrobacter sp. UWEL]|uniref:hypothetical protein n=1 Tax=Fibrobacter sp. UWEL TaxID=1896209 RepID=UPI00091227EE|nr:hypothetical protein [Fibrobacter sp. UWEL]SHL16001.1 hypothetical protein SAMN05720468_11534 [Fibrobacter sp. UWEL]